LFVAAEGLGGLDVRLAFYRGFDEFKVSRWTSDGRELARLMGSIRCLAGRTQIGRMLRYASEQRRETEDSQHQRPPAAVTPSVAPVPVTSPPRPGRRPPQEPTAQGISPSNASRLRMETQATSKMFLSTGREGVS